MSDGRTVLIYLIMAMLLKNIHVRATVLDFDGSDNLLFIVVMIHLYLLLMVRLSDFKDLDASIYG